MLCLRCSRGLTAISKPLLLCKPAQISGIAPSVKRTFTSFRGPSRPTVFPSSVTLRPFLALSTPSINSASPSGEVLDLIPKISTHPALGATQIRCGPRNTFDPSHFVRKRRHGFLSRIRTRKGRATLKRRKSKGRSTLSH